MTKLERVLLQALTDDLTGRSADSHAGYLKAAGMLTALADRHDEPDRSRLLRRAQRLRACAAQVLRGAAGCSEAI